MNRKTKIALKKAIIQGIRRNAERIFSLSQDTTACYVPVDTGNLKRSGIIREITGGSEIIYRAPYAADVEFGIEQDRPITGDQIVHRKPYKRRSYRRKNGVIVPASSVKAHDVRYVNKRLIGLRPKYSKFERGKLIFRVIDKIKARKGQFFLTRAIQEGIPGIVKDIEFYMRRLEA